MGQNDEISFQCSWLVLGFDISNDYKDKYENLRISKDIVINIWIMCVRFFGV